MSCVFLYEGKTPVNFASAHSTKGLCLQEKGFDIHELCEILPMWLYVRHKQVDSALIKAHKEPMIDFSIEDLSSQFGISKILFQKYIENESKYEYSLKRNHAAIDKSKMTLDINVFLINKDSGV
jgi:hypothetical protein